MNSLTKNIILLITLIFAVRSFGCDYPVQVSSGDTVACTGVILTDKQFIEASNNKRELRLKDLKIATLEGTMELMETRHSNYKKELQDTKAKVTELEIKSGIGYVFSFTLGAAITGLIAKELVR